MLQKGFVMAAVSTTMVTSWCGVIWVLVCNVGRLYLMSRISLKRMLLSSPHIFIMNVISLQCCAFSSAGDPSVFTFSMHCSEQSFPAVIQQSDWDIGLPAGTTDQEYLQVRNGITNNITSCTGVTLVSSLITVREILCLSGKLLANGCSPLWDHAWIKLLLGMILTICCIADISARGWQCMQHQ